MLVVKTVWLVSLISAVSLMWLTDRIKKGVRGGKGCA